jgi:hypothetical protein
MTRSTIFSAAGVTAEAIEPVTARAEAGGAM